MLLPPQCVYLASPAQPENIFLSASGDICLGDFGLALHLPPGCVSASGAERVGTLDYLAPEVLQLPQQSPSPSPSTSLPSSPTKQHCAPAASSSPSSPVAAARSGAAAATAAAAPVPSPSPAGVGMMSSSSPFALAGPAPEGAYTHKVDVWGLGVLVYELVAGQPPFEVADAGDTARLILAGRVRCWPPHMSPACASFIQAALVVRPGERPSAEQLLGHPWISAALARLATPMDAQQFHACFGPTVPLVAGGAHHHHPLVDATAAVTAAAEAGGGSSGCGSGLREAASDESCSTGVGLSASMGVERCGEAQAGYGTAPAGVTPPEVPRPVAMLPPLPLTPTAVDQACSRFGAAAMMECDGPYPGGPGQGSDEDEEEEEKEEGGSQASSAAGSSSATAAVTAATMAAGSAAVYVLSAAQAALLLGSAPAVSACLGPTLNTLWSTLAWPASQCMPGQPTAQAAQGGPDSASGPTLASMLADMLGPTAPDTPTNAQQPMQPRGWW